MEAHWTQWLTVLSQIVLITIPIVNTIYGQKAARDAQAAAILLGATASTIAVITSPPDPPVPVEVPDGSPK